MSANFKAFFEAVQRAAREHGVAAHAVCAAVRGTGANVQVGSSAHAPGFMYGEQKILVELEGGGRIPTLRQALLGFPTARFNLDLKVWSAVLPATQIIRELGAESRVLLTSFSDRRRASAIKQVQVSSSAGSSRVLGLWLAAKLRIRPVVHRLAKPVQALQIPTRKGPIRFDSPKFIAQMIGAGLELHYWTINDAEEMKRLISLGAHGIVTDRTDIAVKTL